LAVLLLLGRAAQARDLCRCLEGEGLGVALAHDAAEADRLARATSYSAVVLDQLLPGGAVELLERWRRDGLAVPVLALAARGGDEVARCLEAGADGCAAPPSPPREVAARLRALLRRGRPRGPVLRTFDLEVDTGRRAVRRAGKPIRLSPLGYRLLECLAWRRGEVVSRAELWAQLYPGRPPGPSNLIEVYVSYLRRKVDRGFDPPLVLTHWGQGYQLRADPGPPGRE